MRQSGVIAPPKPQHGLAQVTHHAHVEWMHGKPRSPWRLPLMGIGWLLIGVSPVVGAIPGPGGIFVFMGGVALLIRNSCWAKRRYVMVKRRWPKLGRATDKVMRRRRPTPNIN